MKLRSGFVSNSSSSSFVISAKKNADLKVTVEISLTPDNVLETEADLEEYILNEYGTSDQTLKQLLEDNETEYVSEQYEQYLKEIKKGNVIYIGSVASDDGSPGSNMLYEQGIGDNLSTKGAKLLQDCQG